MKTSRFNRILSALLAFVLFLGCIPTFPVLAQEEQAFRITLEGETVTELKLYPHEKIRVRALGLENGENYQWQILHPERENVWINIYDAKADSLNISVALVKNMLSPDNTAQLRCRANAGGEQVFTPALKVILLDGLTPVVIIPEETTPPTEATEPEVTETTETTAPAEETEPVTEPTESVEVTEPEVTETTVPVEETEPETTETTAPIEETTAPAEPDVSVPETTEPEQTIPVETTVPTESVVLETEPAAVTEETAAVTEPVETVAETVPETTDPAETEATEATAAPTEETIPVTEPETMTMADAAPVRFAARSTAAAAQSEGVEAIAEEETPEFVTVRIEYQRMDYIKNDEGNLELMDNGSAFSPYVATLKYGANLKTIVNNPTMVGYQAYLNGEESSSVSIDETNITESITIIVQYKPALVRYVVRYHLQNVYDDLYVEDTARMREMTGETGAMPDTSVTQLVIPGYTSLYYQPETIAADGSTEFSVYYERNYYLMEFDCTGGYGAETLYVRYGTYISVPNPVRTGYIFEGWDLDKQGEQKNLADGVKDDVLETMPIYNSGYKALWRTINTTFTIVYWAENANDGYYSYWDTASANAMSATSIIPLDIAKQAANSAVSKNLTEAEHFFLNEDKTAAENPATVIIEGDGSSVINVYYSRNRYRMDFVYTGKCLLDEHTHTDACNELACGYVHIHDDSCDREFTCTLQEHAAHTAECLTCGIQEEHTAHTAACLTCGKTNHKHSDACCTIEPHEHSTACCDSRRHTGWNHTCNTNNCGNQQEHTHGEGCVYCKEGLEEHDHSAGCYKDTIHTHDAACYKDTIHIHNDACYTYFCGNGSHTHTNVCYTLKCQITEHTHDNNCTNTRRENKIHSITAKYDANIGYVWETDPILGYLNDGNVWKSSITGQYYSFLENMPNQNIKMTRTEWSGSTYTWYYYLETNDYEDKTGMTLRTDGGVEYKLYHTTKVQGNGISLTYEEDYFPITGYTQRDTKVPSFSSGTAYLYYRIKHPKLKYYNRSSEGPTPAEQDLVYSQPLKSTKKDYEITKEVMERDYYPAGIEPGAYEFGGWYTSPGCYPGSEVDWETATMPAVDLEIYAKWVPITHNVYFYQLYDHVGTSQTWQPEGQDPITYPITVEHGRLLGTTYSYTPTRAGYDFVGWFYMDEDNKKRFAPDSMEVTRDLHLFAEWQSSIDTTYEVTYVLAEDYVVDSTLTYPAGTEVAAPTAGHTSAGKTKTFAAKGGLELYPAFQKNCFPTTNSHSILMQEQNEEESENKHAFSYVVDDKVYYKVRYLDVSTRTEIATSVVDVSYNAIVTVKFKPIAGYVPQNFYLSKTLVSDGKTATEADPVKEENVITFYYVKDELHGMFSVEHYRENPDSTDPTNPANYTKHETIVGSADIKDQYGNQNYYTAELRSYPGFRHYKDTQGKSIDVVTYYTIKPGTAGNPDTITQVEVQNASELKGPITYAGLTIKIYYERIPYDYTIEYREYGAGETAPALQTINSTEKANFGTTVTHTAEQELTIGGKRYSYFIPNPTEADRTKSMTIRVPDTDATTKDNTLIFYYTQKKVNVHYQAVCTVPGIGNFGGLSLLNESATGAEGLGGASATPAAGFEFMGWYTDANCTQPVPQDWLEDRDSDNVKEHMKPKTLDTTLDDVYYYALFKPTLKDLIIKKKATGASATESFLFRVQGRSGTVTADVDMIVVLHGSEDSVTIKDLYAGYYTVTELTGWSWTYDSTVSPPGMQNITENNEFTFENRYNDPDWLGGENYRENVFS